MRRGPPFRAAFVVWGRGCSNALFVPDHEVLADLNGRGIDPDIAGALVESEKLRARLTVEAQEWPSFRPRFLNRTVEHGVSKAASRILTFHGKAVDVEGFAQGNLRPEQAILVVQKHASYRFVLDAAEHEFAFARHTNELFVGGFVRTPERFALLNQPIGGLANKRIGLRQIVDGRAADQKIHRGSTHRRDDETG